MHNTQHGLLRRSEQARTEAGALSGDRPRSEAQEYPQWVANDGDGAPRGPLRRSHVRDACNTERVVLRHPAGAPGASGAQAHDDWPRDADRTPRDSFLRRDSKADPARAPSIHQAVRELEALRRSLSESDELLAGCNSSSPTTPSSPPSRRSSGLEKELALSRRPAPARPKRDPGAQSSADFKTAVEEGLQGECESARCDDALAHVFEEAARNTIRRGSMPDMAYQGPRGGRPPSSAHPLRRQVAPSPGDVPAAQRHSAQVRVRRAGMQSDESTLQKQQHRAAKELRAAERQLEASALALECAKERVQQARQTVRRLRETDAGADTDTDTATDGPDETKRLNVYARLDFLNSRNQLHI